MKNKMLRTKDAFGGLRLLGYLNSEPLLAQYKLDKDGFEIKFNHEIMDDEYAGKFTPGFLESNLEICKLRIAGPLDTIPTTKGGRTKPGTIAWIATLIEIERMKSDLAYKNGKISKGFLWLVANSIFTSDTLYVEDPAEATTFLDAGKYFKLEKNDSRNSNYLDSMIQSTLYPQFLSEVKNIGKISYTTENRIEKIAA